VFVILATVSVAALLPFLNKSIWRDEGASLYSAHLSWSALWHQSLVVDRVLLVYYALLHFWMELSYNVEWARTLSLLAFGLTVYFVGVLASRLAGFWCGLLAIAITSTNPVMVTAALDARPYALVTLTALLAIMSFMKWCDQGEIRWLWVFTVLALATLLLQMFAVLAPLSVASVYFVRSRAPRRERRTLLAPIGTLVVLIVSYLAIVARQQAQITWIPGLNLKSFLEDLEGPASSAQGHLIYPALVVALGAITLFGCLFGWQRGTLRLSRLEFVRLLMCLSWAFGPTVVLVLLTTVKPVYVDRYVTASVPGLAILLALLVTYSARALGAAPRSTKALLALPATVLILVTFMVNSVAVSKAPLENLRGVAQYLMHSRGQASEVALPDHSLTTGLQYYFSRAHGALHMWPQVLDQSYIEGLDLRDNARAFMTARNSVWLVDDGSTKGENMFITELNRHGFVQVSSTSFYGPSVIHFQRQNESKKK
jgi:4-amino-4-deoxy-L-arabinose transferase-like glycosyltransferase